MSANVVNALERLYEWALEANNRLEYEMVDGVQYGGNIYCNPVFREVIAVLDEVRPNACGFNRVEVVKGNDRWAIRKGAVLRMTARPVKMGGKVYLNFSMVRNNQERTIVGWAKDISADEFNLIGEQGTIRVRKA